MSLDCSNIPGAINEKKRRSALDEQPSFKMLGLSSPPDLCTYMISIAETVSIITNNMILVTILTLITLFRKFLSSQQFTIHKQTNYHYHVWAGAPNSYFDMLDKLQKQVRLLVLHLMLLLNL